MNNNNTGLIKNIDDYLGAGKQQSNGKGIQQKIVDIDNIRIECQAILNRNQPNTFPPFVRETSELLNEKLTKLDNLEPIQQTFTTFKTLKKREDDLNKLIREKQEAIEEILTGSINEISQRYIQRPSASGGSKKKIYMKKEQKTPSKKKTTIKKTSLKMKSSQLKTTKKK